MGDKKARLTPPAKEVQAILNRALNCLEPKKIPQWALDMSDDLLETDEVEIVIIRRAQETQPL